jgi:hypothetical protein
MVHEVRNQPLGRLLIRLLDGEVDFVHQLNGRGAHQSRMAGVHV